MRPEAVLPANRFLDCSNRVQCVTLLTHRLVLAVVGRFPVFTVHACLAKPVSQLTTLGGTMATTEIVAKARKDRSKTMKSGDGSASAVQERGAPPTAAALRKKLLLVASSKGGSGKTCTSINLAVQAVHAGLRVATVDLDRQETLTRWAQQRPAAAPVIEHFLIPIDHIRDGLVEIEAADDIDLVIVDTPPGVEDHPEAVRLLLARADYCLVPTGQSPADLNSVTEWMGVLKREQVRAAFLLNRTKRQAKSFERAKLRLIKQGQLCPFDIRDLEDISNVHEVGVGVQEISGARGREDIEGVWDFVRSQIGV
jgi:chromosome partitioning protein